MTHVLSVLATGAIGLFASGCSGESTRHVVASTEASAVFTIPDADVRRRAAVALVPVGENPARVAPLQDGRRVRGGNDVSRLVSVVDTRASAVEKTISVGAGHHEIAGEIRYLTLRVEGAVAPRAKSEGGDKP
jgi:hypothetical protein